jgi:hypothetical protein
VRGRASTDKRAWGISDRGGKRTDRAGPTPGSLGANRWARASGTCARTIIRDLGRAMKIGRRGSDRGGANGCGRRCSSPRRWGRRSWGRRELGWLRGRRSWAERERTPRRTQWRGRGHKSEGREGRTAERGSRAGRRSSGEAFRPRGGGLRRTKAWVSFSRGRGTLGTNARELDRANSDGHHASTVGRCGRAPAKSKLSSTERNRENWARGQVSHLGAELGEAWCGLWQATRSGTWVWVSGGVWWRG